MWWSSLFSLRLSDDKISFIISELLKSSMRSYLHSFAVHMVLLIFEATKAARRFWLAYYNWWFFPTSLIDEGNSYPVFFSHSYTEADWARVLQVGLGKKNWSRQHSKCFLVPYPVTKFFILLCYASIVPWATLADSPQTVITFTYIVVSFESLEPTIGCLQPEFLKLHKSNGPPPGALGLICECSFPDQDSTICEQHHQCPNTRLFYSSSCLYLHSFHSYPS